MDDVRCRMPDGERRVLKKERIKLQIVVALIMILYTCVSAHQGDYGTDGIFMTGAGARADAMAGAFTALADDLSAVHYNPAGLANLPKQEVSILHYPLYESAIYNSIAYGQALLDIGTIAASFFRFSSQNIQGYDLLGHQTSLFSSDQYKATLSYARKISMDFSAGVSIDVYYSSMSRFNYAGFGADAGALYEPFSFLRLGIMVRNIIPPVFSMQSVTETLPRLYTFGALAKYSVEDFRFAATYDVSEGEKEGFKYRAGIEINWSGLAAVRVGYGDGDFSFGAGLALYDARFDYAYVGNQYFGRMDRFSLSYVFGMTIEQQKAQRRKDIYNEVKKIVDEKIRIKITEEAETRYNRAYEFYQKGEFEDALAEVEKSLEWKRDYEPSVRIKKLIEDKLKEKLKMGVSAGLSGVNEAYITAGIEFYEKMQYDEAIKQWEKALKSKPGNKAVQDLILMAKKAMESSAKRTQVSMEQKALADRMYYIAVNRYTSGDLKGAIEIWKKVIAINPDDVKTLRDLRKAQAVLEELSKRGIE